MKELEKIILRKSIRYWVRTSNGNEYLADSICLSSQDDLALLKINIEKSSFLKISDYKELSIGENVTALGFPYQSNFEKNKTDFQPTITSGIITNLADELWSIWHTAVINPGNSGGPLIDNNGNLIGINVGYNSLKKIYFSINTDRLINWLKSINYDYLVSSVKKTDMEKLLSAGQHILIDLEEGYDIYLDGKKIGSTPKLIELNNGNSFIRIENENQYADYKIKFENSINDVFVFEPVFENYYGKLSINVENDPDSIIFLDDCELGKTPIAIEKIKTGSHTITVKSKDKQLFSDEITIKKDIFLEKKYNLKKGQKLLFADTLPIDSLIEISNGKIRVAYLKNEDIFLPKGEWKISIKSKFLNNNNKKQVTMGDTDLVVENIIESEKSILSLIGYETNRKVFIDDQEVTDKITNGKILVLPGYHTLLVTQQDRMPFLKEIEIEKNKELKLFLNMLYTSYPILIDKDKK
ncbi:MAG TPA: PEGA domain-containing protein [Spirochaetota bacterium]|nr:PEGA domain-containing protein [Spirochaetota bacterium]